MQLTSIPQVSSSATLSPLRVLHLAGSTVSDFYYNLSLIYAREVVQPVGVRSHYAVVHPDGLWQLGTNLNEMSEKMPIQEMMAQLPPIEVVVPHLFCFPGMTSIRALFEDILGFPLVGSPAPCTALAANKAHTRDIVSASGVRVAKAQLLHKGNTLTMELPFIVKPNSEDNSIGVTLVETEDQITEAVENGFKHDEILLIEEYIPGREIRVGVIEQEGKLSVLPMIEYLVSDKHPIRTLYDKLDLQSDGMPHQQPQEPVVKTVCPANVSPELCEKLAQAAKKSHIALGCRDYSLYDFRVHEDTHEPYLLEAGLFWSFGQISMISRMLEADGQSLEDVALRLWHKAGKRTRVARGSLFKYVNC